MVKMYYLSDGKNYVMENPYKTGEFLLTTSIVKAKKFTYKQAKNLKNRKGKKFTQFHSLDLINDETGEVETHLVNQKGNGGAYIGTNDVEFDDEILDKIISETKSILGLAGWNTMQLNTYKNQLQIEESKCDSAESDVKHALQKYREEHNKKPQAHKMAKLGYILEEIRLKREKVKLCIRYVDVMKNAITERYTLDRLKLELSKVENKEYKGRTVYWEIANAILNE